MSANFPPYRTGVVRPIQCLQAGWDLVKNQYWLFFGITAIGMLIGSAVPFGIILGPMMCGIYFCLFRRMRNEPVSLDMLFRGFDFFVNGLIVSLLHMLPMLLIIIPSYIIFFIAMVSTMPDPHRHTSGEQLAPLMFFGMFAAFFVVVMVVALAVNVLFFFAYPLLVDRRLSALEAVKTSMSAAMKNLGGVLALLVLNMLLACLGVLLCYVGAFLVLPIVFASMAVAFRQVFPAEFVSHE